MSPATRVLAVMLLCAGRLPSPAAEPPAPAFGHPDVKSSFEMIIGLSGATNRIHAYETSEDLIHWTPLQKVYSDSGESNYRKLRYQSHDREFFRVVEYPPFTVTHLNYRGWDDAVLLGNGQVEVIVVPGIGRVMQFRRTGDDEGLFWVNDATEGLDPSPVTYQNFGGDKAWPAPQHWGWPPPAGFDPVSCTLINDQVVLGLWSPIDSASGISVNRIVALDHFEPKMTITTEFRREWTPTDFNYSYVSVWTVTQLKPPLQVFVPASTAEAFPAGYLNLGDFEPPPPAYLSVSDGLVALQRDPLAPHKIGNDQEQLLWVGSEDVLLMQATRTAGTTYPDGGCSVEIYTNGGADAYVELEFLSHLRQLEPGQSLRLAVTYTLLPRTETDPADEAAKHLAL